MNLKVLLKNFFPTIFIVVAILYLSLMRVSPRSDMPEVPFGDKIVHVVMYMGLMLVFYFDVYRQNLPKSSFRRSLLYGVFSFGIFGGIVELLQMYWHDLSVGRLVGLGSRCFRRHLGIVAWQVCYADCRQVSSAKIFSQIMGRK